LILFYTAKDLHPSTATQMFYAPTEPYYLDVWVNGDVVSYYQLTDTDQHIDIPGNDIELCAHYMSPCEERQNNLRKRFDSFRFRR
jgi:hypothetical protein